MPLGGRTLGGGCTTTSFWTLKSLLESSGGRLLSWDGGKRGPGGGLAPRGPCTVFCSGGLRGGGGCFLTGGGGGGLWGRGLFKNVLEADVGWAGGTSSSRMMVTSLGSKGLPGTLTSLGTSMGVPGTILMAIGPPSSLPNRWL